MAVVGLGTGRVMSEQADGVLRITIPPARHPVAVAFLVLWLCFWPAGEAMAVRGLLGGASDEGLFPPIFFLVIWTLVGLFAAHKLLWLLTGTETIELSERFLRYRKRMTIFGRDKEYALASISHLRPATPVYRDVGEGGRTNGLEDGAICFDYGRRTHKFGLALDEADARLVVAQLCAHTTSLCSSSATVQGAS